MTAAIKLEQANPNDARQLCDLINLAYRGDHGWTIETDMVSGERTSINDINAQIDSPHSHMLVAKQNDQLVACVCIEEEGNKAYIGTFAVAPAFQNMGIGKQVLSLAEDYALNELGISKLMMVVISQRQELIAFYERRGYMRTGKIEKYPVYLKVGIPRIEGLTVEYLEKNT